MSLNDEVVLLVEGKRLLVVALNVENHAGDISGNHTVLNGLVEKFAGDAIASVGLQYRDGHDVALLGTVGEDVFLAGDGTNENVLDVGKLRVALHGLELVVEVL